MTENCFSSRTFLHQDTSKTDNHLAVFFSLIARKWISELPLQIENFQPVVYFVLRHLIAVDLFYWCTGLYYSSIILSFVALCYCCERYNCEYLVFLGHVMLSPACGFFTRANISLNHMHKIESHLWIIIYSCVCFSIPSRDEIKYENNFFRWKERLNGQIKSYRCGDLSEKESKAWYCNYEIKTCCKRCFDLKHAKRGWTRLKHIINIIYLFILLDNFDFCKVSSF